MARGYQKLSLAQKTLIRLLARRARVNLMIINCRKLIKAEKGSDLKSKKRRTPGAH